MKCPRCDGDHVIKFGKKDGLTPKQRYLCHACKHMFYVKVLDHKPTKPLKRFSLKKETLRQIIHADIEEDKNRKIKEYLI